MEQPLPQPEEVRCHFCNTLVLTPEEKQSLQCNDCYEKGLRDMDKMDQIHQFTEQLFAPQNPCNECGMQDDWIMNDWGIVEKDVIIWWQCGKCDMPVRLTYIPHLLGQHGEVKKL